MAVHDGAAASAVDQAGAEVCAAGLPTDVLSGFHSLDGLLVDFFGYDGRMMVFDGDGDIVCRLSVNAYVDRTLQKFGYVAGMEIAAPAAADVAGLHLVGD